MFTIAGVSLKSRLFLGTARFPSPAVLLQAVERSRAEVLTVSLRRHNPEKKGGESFWGLLKELPLRFLPNTAGCRSVKEAVLTAHLGRELFDTRWVKLEITCDEAYLAPDTQALVEATRILKSDGFEVFPYTTEDLSTSYRLLEAGAVCLMPWGSPIGSARGIENLSALQRLRKAFPETPLILDAGVGAPSHACTAMELGFDAVLLNSAVALAVDPVGMAGAFADAIRGGRAGFEAGILAPKETAESSTPTWDKPEFL